MEKTNHHLLRTVSPLHKLQNCGGMWVWQRFDGFTRSKLAPQLQRLRQRVANAAFVCVCLTFRQSTYWLEREHTGEGMETTV